MPAGDNYDAIEQLAAGLDIFDAEEGIGEGPHKEESHLSNDLLEVKSRPSQPLPPIDDGSDLDLLIKQS